MYLIYRIVLFLALLISWPYLVLRALIGSHGLKERLGIWDFMPDGRKTIWFHAASMGELKVIATILPKLNEIVPDIRIVITTVTKTGKDRAGKFTLPVEAYYLPIDLKSVVRRVNRKIKPALLVLAETELWPVLIRQSKQDGVIIAVVNGRISTKSFRLYKMFKSLFSPVLRSVDLLMAQTESDSKRFIELGALPANISVFGNTKFDQALIQDIKPSAKELVDFLQEEDKFAFIAGSVRAGEIKEIVETVGYIQRDANNIKTVIAPRHMKDLKLVERSLKSFNMDYIKRTDLQKAGDLDNPVLVLDTMGELGGLYRFADLAFVGGSLEPLGGHDPLEPASVGCMVCFGPYMDNSRMFADFLVRSGGAVYVKNARELSHLVKEIATDKKLAKDMGEKARQAVIAGSGVSQKIAEKLAEFI